MMRDTFLNRVVDDLVGRYGLTGLGDLTLVFPMQRAGLFVKQELMKRIGMTESEVPVLLPHFTTIDALSDSLSKLGKEDEILSVCRLYEAYRKHASDTLPLDVFYGWGSQLMTDFSNADMALLDVAKLMQFSADATSLDEVELDEEVRERLLRLLGTEGEPQSVRRYFRSLWTAIPAIYQTFTASQRAAEVGTRGARSRWVIEHFDDERVQSRIVGRTFVFVGFNYLLEAERQLMLHLRDQATALFYWDYDPEFHLDDSIYKFLRDDIALFGNSYPTTQQSSSEAVQQRSGLCSKISAIACSSSAAQAAYVHDWLLQHHHAGDRTAIVLADESMLQSVIYSLPRAAEDPLFERVNVTKGYPLRNTRIYADVVREMEGREYTDMSYDELLRTLAERIEGHYHHAARRADGDWQQVLTDEAYYQSQLVLRSMRTLLQQHPEVATAIPSSTLLMSLIRRRMEAVSIPFHGEPITDIQIIGVLETRLLDFDHVLILNVEEGVVPNTAVDRSFIPYDIRKMHGMQTRDEEAKIYGYNFFRLLRRAEDVTMTFSQAATEMGQKSMSRFLMQLLTSSDYQVQRYSLLENNKIEDRPSTDPRLTLDRPSIHSLSPSAICDFVECKRMFYYKFIRDIREVKEDSVLLSSSSFGTLVHATLEAYYKANKQISLSQGLDIAYKEFGKAVRAEHEAENFAILQLAENICTLDAQQHPAIYALEKKIEYTEGLSIPISGKIDRMDILSENDQKILRVADYKTGSYDAAKMKFSTVDELFSDPQKRYALQTLIYSAMVHHSMPSDLDATMPIMPQLLYPRKISADMHLICNNVPVTDYVKQLAKSFEEMLAAKVEEIRTESDYPMTDLSVCEKSYCPFHLLCGRKKKEY